MALTGAVAATAPLPSLDEAMAARRDVWGEAAMAQPNGASYEFMAPLLPPPRYVNADFRHYPIILCAPEAKAKARLISDGRGLNHRGGARSWNDVGVPVTFRVGPDEFLFGSLRDRVSEPTLAEGWMPIAEIRYSHRSPVQSEGRVPLNQEKRELPPEIYRLEAFASTAPDLAAHGVVFVRFDLAQGTNGFVAVDVDADGPVTLEQGRLIDAGGRVRAIFDASWKRERGRMVARLRPGGAVTLAVPTVPLARETPLSVSPAGYIEQRAACAATWREWVGRGAQVEVPEPLVNNAWRNALCQNFQLIAEGQLRYSTGNQYDRIYAGEGSDAVMALLDWGFAAEARRLIEPILDFTRKGLEQHQASFKLNNVIRTYWQTRDATAVQALRPRWEKEAARLDRGRTGANGLYPPEQYCGDIHTLVQSLNANAKAWRALRDLGAMLAEMGGDDTARHYTTEAAAFRRVVLQAVEQSAVRTTTPPFVPIALDGGEPAHDPILHSRIGSYWNIIIGYTLGSGIFPPGSEQENWIPHYQERNGGIFLGLVRSGGAQFNFWTNDQRVNPLYGTRYALDSLRRDEPERALVSFYGTLAQGLTRNTFVGGEGCTLEPVDAEGRIFYCPPNSTASAHVLAMLRGLLVQDLDGDDDGRPDTLRLMFGTSRRWLEDGKTIRAERMPTPFGEVAVTLRSQLQRGEVLADVSLPERNPAPRTLLRVRVPDGWRVRGARAGDVTIPTDAQGTVDLSALRGRVSLRFAVERR
ncbi:hypothetical protein [Horticoccus sp. 23ND18S-11]|uniref:hypothetical protein n=1 Tax=Horticoccus sp. 23ND18S-11 TaxID=3391832 RepID=UPI0039C9144F